ncbi:hypothetical protein MY10362_004316 [Beauveria mimosiformis]
MHALAFLSLVASTALVAAQDQYASFQPLSTFGTLQARQQQSCASVGGKTCGAKCIQLSYTCCGNGAGACEVGYTCGLAANGIYGCCPLGKRCRGDAPDPSTTDIGVARPTTVRGGGAGDVDDGDETTTRAAETTTRRLTPTNTPARTTAVMSDDATTSSSTTRMSTSTTRSSVVASGTSSSSVNGAGSDSNANGSGSSTTAGSGGNGSQASSAGNISVGLASLAGGFIAVIASLL